MHFSRTFHYFISFGSKYSLNMPKRNVPLSGLLEMYFVRCQTQGERAQNTVTTFFPTAFPMRGIKFVYN
jgi:hypothetical protein